MQVTFFITCFNDTLFPEVGQATVRVLERLGHTVDVPLEQTCCGQMHFNTGYQLETIPLVRRFVEVFRDAEVVVGPSASCLGMIREFYPRVAEVADDARLAEEVRLLLPRIYELTEFLTDVLKVEDVGAYFPHRVTYHPTCTHCGCCTSGIARHACCGRYAGLILSSCQPLKSAVALAVHLQSRMPIHLLQCSAISCAMCWIPMQRCW